MDSEIKLISYLAYLIANENNKKTKIQLLKQLHEALNKLKKHSTHSIIAQPDIQSRAIEHVANAYANLLKKSPHLLPFHPIPALQSMPSSLVSSRRSSVVPSSLVSSRRSSVVPPPSPSPHISDDENDDYNEQLHNAWGDFHELNDMLTTDGHKLNNNQRRHVMDEINDMLDNIRNLQHRAGIQPIPPPVPAYDDENDEMADLVRNNPPPKEPSSASSASSASTPFVPMQLESEDEYKEAPSSASAPPPRPTNFLSQIQTGRTLNRASNRPPPPVNPTTLLNSQLIARRLALEPVDDVVDNDPEWDGSGYKKPKKRLTKRKVTIKKVTIKKASKKHVKKSAKKVSKRNFL